MSKLTRLKNWAGGPGEVLRQNLKGKPVPGGSLTNGKVGGLKSARRKGK